jgi:RNA polymerase sigma factor (sigma-70 family)
MSYPDAGPKRAAGDPFDTTHWSIVLAAGLKPSSEARAALSVLCETYWFPVYAYVRRRVPHIADAQDLTQEFFAHLLDGNRIAAADPTRGRFRAFLLTALKNFLSSEWQKMKLQKRGGGRPILSLDFPSGEVRFAAQPADEATPDQLFEREWVITLLEHVVRRLSDQYVADGKAEQFELLKGCITADEPRFPYATAAKALGISENAVQVAAHRLRKQYRTLLRGEIAQTVDDPREIDDEIRRLIATLSAG